MWFTSIIKVNNDFLVRNVWESRIQHRKSRGRNSHYHKRENKSNSLQSDSTYIFCTIYVHVHHISNIPYLYMFSHIVHVRVIKTYAFKNLFHQSQIVQSKYMHPTSQHMFVVQNLFHQIHSNFNSKRFYSLLVVFVLRHISLNRFWDVEFTKFCHGLQGRVGTYYVETWHDRDVYLHRRTFFVKGHEGFYVKYRLCDNKIGPGINLKHEDLKTSKIFITGNY